MKKFLNVLLASMMVFASACGSKTEEAPAATATPEATAEAVEETAALEATAEAAEEAESEEVAVMSHEEYAAAELDSEVCVETYVQAKQSWWQDKGTFYCQSEDGAYFLYEMPCSQEEYDALTPGTKIRVTGYKSEWSGEVEITEAKFEVLEGNFVAEPVDVTELLGTEDLIAHQNEFVSFKGMTVEAANDEGAAYLYKWDGSGEEGDDLYFNVSVNGETYSFTVESYLCDKDSDVYKAVQALEVGQTVDMEGFLYWYEGANPHITSVTVAE